MKDRQAKEFPIKGKSTFNSASYVQVSVLIQFPDVSGSHPSRFPVYCFCRFIRFVEVTHENMASVHHDLKRKIIIPVKIPDNKFTELKSLTSMVIQHGPVFWRIWETVICGPSYWLCFRK